jgi:hypothetical protein
MQTTLQTGLQPIRLYICRLQQWLCRTAFPDQFFNRDASLEIDRLTVENERLRNGGAHDA